MSDKYVPESVRAKLVVGQRVRYVPPDEPCDYPSERNSPSDRYGATSHESFTDAEGQIGTITETNHWFSKGHPYFIVMDEWYRFGSRHFKCIVVAAHELALVED